jgi:hypothetical protein
MIQQEELHIKQFTTGVTFFIFSDAIYDQLPESPDQYGGPFPSYVVYNMQGEIYSLNYFTGNVIWTRNENNNYIPIDEIGWNYKTGYTLVKTIASNMTQDNIDNMSSLMLQRLSNPDRLGTPPSASAATNYVFFKKQLIDDFYVDLKLERSYNSLDTLKIYNNLVNSFPNQESPTGVVFGRLTAIQKIKNENGENLRIPLQNVPLGVFNPSDEYPQIFSTDDNGDRLTLNIKESTIPSEYFDTISYSTDYNSYLKSAESFSAVPAQYKYITKTNENGEFILYDIPVGQQVVVFEVDLFKQGLTKDEIALNFFPFPTTEQPNIDTIPSFAYKQFPIDVVPAWGRGQTGYTSLDININLDLRKWTTYIIPPVTISAQKLNLTTAQNPNTNLKVDIRDMTAPGFIKKPIEIVQIADDLDRDSGAQYLWFNEFSQKKKSIQFNNFGCSVFKLPGNIYDPSGYRTDKDGNPTTNKGVWLASYQFNIYLDKLYAQRSTGAVFYFNTTGNFIRSHYHLNYTEGSQTPGSVESALPQVGTFPYEKPWSATYPEKYSIPKKPTQQRFQYGSDRLTYPTSTASNPIYYSEEPAYLDGDLVGIPVGGSIGNAGGFGVQYNQTFWFYNRIASVATNSYMYKYEDGVSWSETYANGYEPYWNASNNPFPYDSFPFAGLSKVVGGEKYQRLECGYGYFVKPQGWSRIVRQTWGEDAPQDIKYLSNYSTSDNPGPSSSPSGIDGSWYSRRSYPLTLYNIDNQNLTLHLGYGTAIKEGALDFYRIVESGPNSNGDFVNISPASNFIIPTYSVLRIEGAAHCYNIRITNKGTESVNVRNPYRASVRVISADGSSTVGFVSPGNPIALLPNESFQPADLPAQAVWPTTNPYLNSSENSTPFGGTAHDGSTYLQQLQASGGGYFYWRHSVDFTSIYLPGNDQYNSSTNKFEKSLYKVDVTYYKKQDWTVDKFGGNAFIYVVQDAGSKIQQVAGNLYGKYENLAISTIQNSLYNTSNSLAASTKSANLYGDANVGATNTYYLRTNTNGHSNGLVHEGLGKNFYYNNTEYYLNETDGNNEWIELYSLAIEGPTSSLWGDLNDGNQNFGFGRYAP